MSEDMISRILEELNAKDAQVLDLFQTYQGRDYSAFWQQDARLYRAFGKQLISASHPTKAFEVVREGLLYHKDDLELFYLSALALARGRNVSKSSEYVHDLLDRIHAIPSEARRSDRALDERLTHLESEALSLVGRLQKDVYERTSDPGVKAGCAIESARAYERAYQLSGRSFPGINAATMSLLSGQPDKGRRLAAEVITRVASEREQRGRENDYWLLATLGEARVLLGNQSEAADWYREAVHHAAGKIGDIASMRRNLLLISEKMEISDELLAPFNFGSLVVFSGHMIDHPDRVGRHNLPERFPPVPELEERVGLAIRKEVDALNARFGYCSAACGSDILFAEEMLKRKAELHIVLPFDKEDFYFTSVDFGYPHMAQWRARCDELLNNQAIQKHYATKENFLGDEALFEFVNTVTQGLAITRAKELDVTPYAVVVLDPASEALPGGTAYFLKRWTDGGRAERVVDLASLRAEVKAASVSFLGDAKPSSPVGTGGHIRRQVKVMLFADVKNFSKLTEAQTPAFFLSFLSEVRSVMDESRDKPVFCNTWGDGLFLVFDRVTDAADFAMRLLDRVEKVDWQKFGLPKDTTVRMGIHAGPVYPTAHPILNRDDFFGSHVNRAARIEPVTTPGCAFTSEQFAAVLAVEPGHNFVCEYIGIEDLAKGYDQVPLYRLARR